MTVHIGEMTSEVEAMPESASAAASTGASGSEPWKELDRLRAIRAAMLSRERRTRCEGYDD
jgi:hypothetical protein